MSETWQEVWCSKEKYGVHDRLITVDVCMDGRIDVAIETDNRIVCASIDFNTLEKIFKAVENQLDENEIRLADQVQF